MAEDPYEDVGRSFEVLAEEDCMSLLSEGWLGRVAVTMGAIPAVFPVNYCAEGGAIYFRTGEGSKLAAATKSATIAFQVDEVDVRYHHGWSVLAVGMAHEVHEDEVRTALACRLQPWAPGERNHLIQMLPEFVSGRRISFGVPHGLL